MSDLFDIHILEGSLVAIRNAMIDRDTVTALGIVNALLDTISDAQLGNDTKQIVMLGMLPAGEIVEEDIVIGDDEDMY